MSGSNSCGQNVGPVLMSCTRSVALPIIDADGASARSI